MFSTSANHGFTMEFQNGWTISVQWGKNNYCERRTFDIDKALVPEDGKENVECLNAEIAAWYGHRDPDKSTDNWLEIDDYSHVEGWLNTNEVAAWIAKVAAFKGDHKLESERLRLDERITEFSSVS